jgi:hypothetical protein
MDALIRVPTVASPGPRDNNTANFGQTSDNQLYVHLFGSASLSFFNSEGQITATSPTQDVIRYGTNTALNQEITFRFSTNNASDAFGLIARINGSTANTINAYAFFVQGNTMNMIKIIKGISTTLLYQPFSQANGILYRMRFSVIGSTLTTLMGRVWPEGQTEPTNWAALVSDTNAPLPAGGFGMYVKEISSNPLQFDSLVAVSTSSAGVIYRLPQTIANNGSQTLTWAATSNQSWCAVDIPSGSIAAGGAAQTFTILVNVSTLSSGTHAALVTVTTNAGNFTVPVSITVP